MVIMALLVYASRPSDAQSLDAPARVTCSAPTAATLSPYVSTTACAGVVPVAASSAPTTISAGPGNYASSVQCTWVFSARMPIRVQFSFFATENGYDVVKIYDGTSTSSPLLRTLSGVNLPSASLVVTSSGGGMTIAFTSDASVESQGFVATVTTAAPASSVATLPPLPAVTTPAPQAASPGSPSVSAAAASPRCSGVVQLQLVTSSAPIPISDGPGDYPSSNSCTWLVSANRPVTLRFSSFATEFGYDFLKIYDGLSTSSPLLQSLTGLTLPSLVTSSAGGMTIVFTSDSLVEAAGFEATVALAVPGSAGAAAYLPTPSPLWQPVLVNGQWVVQTQAPVPAISAAPTGSPTGLASYDASRPCAGVVQLTLSSAPITISDGRGNYQSYSNCVWVFSTRGSTAQLTVQFLSFATESGYDFVKVYDGLSTSSPILQSLSGSVELPRMITSSSGSIAIQLTSDSSVEAAGFVATVVGADASNVGGNACSGVSRMAVSTNTPVAISDGPGNYATATRCGWAMSANGPLTVQFSSFATEYNYDFVNIYDGNSTSSPLLQSLSGSTLPGAVISSGNGIFIELTSDGSIEDVGFSATVTTAPIAAAAASASLVASPSPVLTVAAVASPAPLLAQACGTVRVYASSIPTEISDGPFADYVPLSNCVWVVSAGGPVTLRFSSFATEFGYDFLKIYDGLSTSSPLLQSLTGLTLPSAVISSGNGMTIVFTSDSSVEAAGFVSTVTCCVSSQLSDNSDPVRTVSIQMSGVLSDFDGDRVARIKTDIAAGLGIAESTFSLSLSAGSVIVSVTMRGPSAVALATRIRTGDLPSLGGSAVLGVSISELTSAPTIAPSPVPSQSRTPTTTSPTQPPTASPTLSPTIAPSTGPSRFPTVLTSSLQPSLQPSLLPTMTAAPTTTLMASTTLAPTTTTTPVPAMTPSTSQTPTQMPTTISPTTLTPTTLSLTYALVASQCIG